MGQATDRWINNRIERARRGDVAPYSLKFVEAVTNVLPPEFYREDEDVRNLKRELGLRRAAAVTRTAPLPFDADGTIDHLTRVASQSPEPVLQLAARSLAEYLR